MPSIERTNKDALGAKQIIQQNEIYSRRYRSNIYSAKEDEPCLSVAGTTRPLNVKKHQQQT